MYQISDTLSLKRTVGHLQRLQIVSLPYRRSIGHIFRRHFQTEVTLKPVMSRPLLLVTLLLLMVLTSQLDWNQKIVNEVEARSSAISIKQQNVLEREESVKEKIILSQEKHIQKLKTLVQSLQEQLLLCRGKDEIVNDTTGSLTELLNELKQQQIME